MSLQDAEQFINDCQEKTNEKIENILKNLNSKFESQEAKFHYISKKAEEFEYYFTPIELIDALKSSKTKLKKDQLLKVVGGSNLNSLKNIFKEEIEERGKKARKLWESLWWITALPLYLYESEKFYKLELKLY